MNEVMSRFWAWLGGALVVLVGLISIIMFVDWLNKHIDERVDEKILSREVIDKLGRTVKPYVLFNQNETVLIDGGAMVYFDSIRVDTSGSGYDVKVMTVVVFPNRYQATYPFLSCIDIPEHIYRPRRGRGYSLIYELINPNVSGLDEIRFRLEPLVP